jgi:hypothetical protein
VKQLGNARIYAQDEKNMLWIMRQTSVAPGMPALFGWSKWRPLGNECIVLGTGCTMLEQTIQTRRRSTCSAYRLQSLCERLEQPGLQRICRGHVFRMPFHAHYKPFVRLLNRFDRAVFRVAGGHEQSISQTRDRLMMS